ncbi:alpha/beta fold hydrolase [Luteibacter sp. CQ10]|uniref:alpha/beta fold hydrolase n=1 Tax=Luteibacter sp. CQ10 TaxID=2805821 RepID=UPI0034A42818
MRRPVVYIHGFLGHLRFPELSTGLSSSRVYAPDLLGYGAFAEAPIGHVSIAHQAAHLRQWIQREAGPTPAVLVAHSAGAAVAIAYAHNHPERVAAVVSAEGNLAPSDAFLSSRLAPMTVGGVEAWLAAARRNPGSLLASDEHRLSNMALARLSEWLDHQGAQTIHGAARAVLMETLRPGYAADVMSVMAHVPTFLIHGERTPLGLGVPPRLRELAAQEFVIAGTGHAMVVERPESVAHVVAQVLARIQ